MLTVEKFETERWMRDLNWAVSSPFLMHGAPSVDGELSELAGPPPKNGPGYRVGSYFENLICYWLQHARGVEMLAQGFQVLEEKRTLGELDFVFRDETGQVHHWEVAIKFYLHCADQQVAGSHFIGSGAKDTFEKKRDKIFDRQLPLSEKPFPEVNFRSAFVKGRIFYHPLQVEPRELPDGLMPDHLRGVWLRHSELSWLHSSTGSEAGTTRFYLAAKPFWLSPERFSASSDSPRSFQNLEAQLDRHFSAKNRPVLLSSLSQDETGWRETERIFVVPDRWPATGA